jgi:hypothetical protein
LNSEHNQFSANAHAPFDIPTRRPKPVQQQKRVTAVRRTRRRVSATGFGEVLDREHPPLTPARGPEPTDVGGWKSVQNIKSRLSFQRFLRMQGFPAVGKGAGIPFDQQQIIGIIGVVREIRSNFTE